MTAAADAADAFRALHRPGEPVVLANAWDAATARAVAAAGYPAVATSSVAVAESLGYADGGVAPPEAMFAAARRIADAVHVPVTVDAENGYGLPPDELVSRLLDAGAVGCNIEDSTAGVLADVEAHAVRLAALREAALAAGVPLVINARVDSFLRHAGAEPEALPDAVARGRRYLAAGADCVYPIGCRRPETIRALVAEVDGPVNVHWSPDGPGPAELAGLGVARISTGGALWHRAMDAFGAAATALRAEATRGTTAG